jgi:hypothetical protein
LPWPVDGGPPSFVNIHHVVRLTDDTGQPRLRPDGKPMVAVPGRACRTLDEAVRAIEWAVGKATDIYVCMAGQRTAEEKISKRGFKYNAAIRRLDNIAAHKSLYCDVDVKPADLKHGYATPQEAVREFARIVKEIRLPKPSFVIMSGSGGFHAHWTLVEPIAAERWRLLSGALCAAVMAKGFRGDTQCIVDGVRLLRVPGTWNYKNPTPSPVRQTALQGPDYFAEALEHPLAAYIGAYVAPTPKAIPLKPSALGAPAGAFAGVTLAGLPDGLATGLELLLPTIDEVAHGCPFIARTLATGGAANPNPLWLQTTNVALFCQDPRGSAHRLSQGHPTYTTGETDALVDRQEATRHARDLGWPRCATVAAYGAPECGACPNRALGKSPLNFAGRPAAPSAAHQHGQPAQPQAGGATAAAGATGLLGSGAAGNGAAPSPLAALPSLYEYDPSNRISLVLTDDQGNKTYQPLCSYLLEKPWLQQDPPSLNFTTVTHQGHERQIKVPYEVINDKNSFGKTLSRQGMLPSRGELPDLGDFFVAWIDKMRNDAANVVQSQPFGWSVRNGQIEGFVYAGHLWSAGVPRPASNPDHVLASQYSPSGDLSKWLDAAKMITNQQRPALDAILASAFAAPLVRFTGQTGILLSTYSTLSGIGKSSTLKVAQSVWGHPQKAIQSLSDTQNAVLKKIGDIKNLPLFWDELKTEEDTHKFVNLAFQLSLGKEKSRLASDTSYREPGTWQTLLCSTSNDSVLAYVLSHTKTTAAGLYRVFEYEVPRGVIGQISPAEAALILNALNDNYGNAGLAYAQFLGAHHGQIAAEVADYSKRLEQAYQIQADERFWLALIVTLVMGAHYANALNLTAINVDALTRFLLDKLQGMRNERNASTVDIHHDVNIISILSRYINEHRSAYAVVTNVVHRTNTKAAPAAVGQPGSVQLKVDPTRVRAVRLHIGEDDHWVRIIKAPFDEWLAERGMTPPLIHKQLHERLGIVQVRGRLAVGTPLVTATEQCLEFNYGDPVFQGILEL